MWEKERWILEVSNYKFSGIFEFLSISRRKKEKGRLRGDEWSGREQRKGEENMGE